jgi:aminoglycoside 6'-N-acetyltransferase
VTTSDDMSKRMTEVHGARTVVRNVRDDDVDMLVEWHARPDVSRYWDDKTYTREQLLEKFSDAKLAPFVVECDGVSVGYVQAWWDEPGGGGIDMFLVPDARGRGLGPDAARALATHLLREWGLTRVTVDPYLWNDGAVRAWRRAGFEPVSEHEPDDEHSAPWLLMEFRG